MKSTYRKFRFTSNAGATHTPTPYSTEWKLAYAAGKLGLIPAFGDSIGKDVNKAELALCAKYVAQAKESHAQLVAALSAMYCAGFWTADELPNLPPHQRKAIEEARAALQAAKEE